ncbi:HEAT repeat domain-containing protein [Streptomyces sp. NPDC127068]|uniref:HEAT repeat domain-containing protein n=1 Tax=Streptomyces sp. NPDC127068 TaxID=3347127 RepID=UPI003662A884
MTDCQWDGARWVIEGSGPRGNGEGQAVLNGIEDVDWASMQHAYGDASDVPSLLRGLASDDPAERDTALDGMYGAVHHQGDVYACTVASVPFLFALLGLPAVRDRSAVLELLCSIAGEREPDPEEIGSDCADEAEHAAWVAPFVDASALIRGRSAELFPLLDDPDPQVRAVAPGALVRLHGDAGRLLTALRRRLRAEPDPEAARALVTAIGDLGVRTGEVGAAAGGCLAEVARDPLAPPALLLAALTGLARCAPDRLPPGAVAAVGAAMRGARQAPEAAPAEPRPRTDTLVSYLRELRTEHRTAVDADGAIEQLGQLHLALMDRTDERLALLVDQLRNPSRGQRRAAVEQAGMLLTGWRLPGGEAVRLLARQALDGDERLARAALGELVHLHPLARGVADVIAEALPAFRHEADDADWFWTRFGRAVALLAAQGDPRAVPELARALRSGSVPDDLQEGLAALSTHAAPLGEVLGDRLARLHPGAHRRRARLLDALAVPAPAAALPLVASFLDSEDVATRLAAQRTVARYGVGAAEHAPALRAAAVSDPSPYRRSVAAEALWSVVGAEGLELVLGAVEDVLRLDRPNDRGSGFRTAGRLGRSGAALAPLLRTRLAEDGHRPEAALALWRVVGDAQEVAPVLVAEWTRSPFHLVEIAGCLAELGAAGADAAPLARAELARPRRHGNEQPAIRLRCHVASDEKLLHGCRRVLARAPQR